MGYIIDIISIFNKLIFLKRLGLKMKVVCQPYFGWNYVAVNCIILYVLVFFAQCRLASTRIRHSSVKLIVNKHQLLCILRVPNFS